MKTHHAKARQHLKRWMHDDTHDTSWWVGLSREELSRRVEEQELQRMQSSRYGSPWANAGLRVTGIEAAETRAAIVKPRIRNRFTRRHLPNWNARNATKLP